MRPIAAELRAISAIAGRKSRLSRKNSDGRKRISEFRGEILPARACTSDADSKTSSPYPSDNMLVSYVCEANSKRTNER